MVHDVYEIVGVLRHIFSASKTEKTTIDKEKVDYIVEYLKK